MKRFIYGLAFNAFMAALVYSAWLGNKAATGALVVVALLELIGTLQLQNEKRKIHVRTGWPGWASFPFDMALCAVCMFGGGWMAFAGVVIMFCACTDLSVFVDNRPAEPSNAANVEE